jgi:hypothetical protein
MGKWCRTMEANSLVNKHWKYRTYDTVNCKETSIHTQNKWNYKCCWWLFFVIQLYFNCKCYTDPNSIITVNGNYKLVRKDRMQSQPFLYYSSTCLAEVWIIMKNLKQDNNLWVKTQTWTPDYKAEALTTELRCLVLWCSQNSNCMKSLTFQWKANPQLQEYLNKTIMTPYSVGLTGHLLEKPEYSC